MLLLQLVLCSTSQDCTGNGTNKSVTKFVASKGTGCTTRKGAHQAALAIFGSARSSTSVRVVGIERRLVIGTRLWILIGWLRGAVIVAAHVLLLIVASILLLVWILVLSRLSMLEAAGSRWSITLALVLSVALFLTVRLLLLAILLVVTVRGSRRSRAPALLVLRGVLALRLTLRIVRVILTLLSITRRGWRASVLVRVLVVGVRHFEFDVVCRWRG